MSGLKRTSYYQKPISLKRAVPGFQTHNKYIHNLHTIYYSQYRWVCLVLWPRHLCSSHTEILEHNFLHYSDTFHQDKCIHLLEHLPHHSSYLSLTTSGKNYCRLLHCTWKLGHLDKADLLVQGQNIVNMYISKKFWFYFDLIFIDMIANYS